MPRKTDKTAMSILMTKDEISAVNELARSAGFKITADYIRSLISRDAEVRGKSIQFDVDRGGNRREKTGE